MNSGFAVILALEIVLIILEMLILTQHSQIVKKMSVTAKVVNLLYSNVEQKEIDEENEDCD